MNILLSEINQLIIDILSLCNIILFITPAIIFYVKLKSFLCEFELYVDQMITCMFIIPSNSLTVKIL